MAIVEPIVDKHPRLLKLDTHDANGNLLGSWWITIDDDTVGRWANDIN